MSNKDKKFRTVDNDLIEQTEIKEEIKKPELKIAEIKMSFDVYFQALMQSKPGKILPHHKAAMWSYAKSKGVKQETTKTEFDSIFKTY